ncbi:tyrosine-type recombinase/integrase [uncultured Paludibaculum sp.]|uniref:tyrosine-type recombinase/integrase n=1 Tax=uncultured Paludibaculum sp. TaxID=1765020 RepID=UPI002AAAB938|nr:tyrosine-type recombinase/integrase [uncultured Paludibaculum sp.]
MLTLFRRHTPKCPHKAKGRTFIKCKCPVSWDITGDFGRERKSAGTRDWERARKKAQKRETELENGASDSSAKPIADAVKLFLASLAGRAFETLRNNRRTLEGYQTHLRGLGIYTVREIKAEHVELFLNARPVEASTKAKELGILRHFGAYCVNHEWSPRNPARIVERPKVKRKEKRPYTDEEFLAMLAAANNMGRGAYERLRARAALLVLRYTAMGISDVVSLQKSDLADGMLTRTRTKTGNPIRLNLASYAPQVLDALANLPEPKGADGISRYYFWSGNGSIAAAKRDLSRTLKTVFKLSGVVGAHSHRFRHTLATALLEAGGTAEDAANILGNSPAMVLRHYAQHSVKRQEQAEHLLQRTFGAPLAQMKN